MAAAVHTLARLIELLAVGHDDAAVVLGMLQIVLGQHRVSARLGLARQRDVLLGDMRRVCPGFVSFGPFDSKLRDSGLLVAFAMVVPATSAAVLLSLPH